MIIPTPTELAFCFDQAFLAIIKEMTRDTPERQRAYLETQRSIASSHRILLDAPIPPGETAAPPAGKLSYFTGSVHEQRREAILSLPDGTVLERSKSCSLLFLLALFMVATRIAQRGYTYVITEEVAKNPSDRELIGKWALHADGRIERQAL